MTDAESTATLVKQVRFAFSSVEWGIPLLIVVFSMLLALVRWPRWQAFATRKKWISRVVLFFLTLILAYLIHLAEWWGQAFVPGHASPERPFITAILITQGLSGLVWDHEFESQLSPEKQKLAKCIEALSLYEAQNYQNKCGDNRACFENIPAMTKKDRLRGAADTVRNGLAGRFCQWCSRRRRDSAFTKEACQFAKSAAEYAHNAPMFLYLSRKYYTTKTEFCQRQSGLKISATRHLGMRIWEKYIDIKISMG